MTNEEQQSYWAAYTAATRAEAAEAKRHIWASWGTLIEYGSGEWLLTKWNLANGGSVILLRAILTTIAIALFAIAVRNGLDPAGTWQPSLFEFRTQVKDGLPWLAGTLGAVYAAFYTRFASQWSYLAGVYNQIKATECQKTATKRPWPNGKLASLRMQWIYTSAASLFSQLSFRIGVRKKT